MDTLIVQLGIKHGRVPDFFRGSGPKINLGRSYENDVVLTDIHVDPKQIQFYQHEQQWFVRILDNTNPVLLNGKVLIKEAEPVAIKSGDRMILGRTSIQLFLSNHAVEATRKLLLSNWIQQWTKRLITPFLVLLSVCVGDMVLSYFTTSIDLKWGGLIASSFGLAISVLLWAGLWSLAGRLFRHQLLFGAQLLVTSLAFGIASILTSIGSYIEYFSNSLTVGIFSSYITAIIIMIILFRLNLYYATTLKNSTIVAMVLGAGLALAFYGLDHFGSKDTFNYQAEFSDVLKPPYAYMGKGENPEQYIQALKESLSTLNFED